MSRVYSHDLGIEKAFIHSYDGWSETNEGVQFYNCDFRLGYLIHGADCLYINYAHSQVELYRGDILVYQHDIKIVLD